MISQAIALFEHVNGCFSAWGEPCQATVDVGTHFYGLGDHYQILECAISSLAHGSPKAPNSTLAQMDVLCLLGDSLESLWIPL